MEFVDVFQVLAADDFDDRRTNRKAVAIAVKRSSTRFSGFLAAASDKDDYEARVDLIADELHEVVASACEDMGHEFSESIEQIVRQQLVAAGGFCDDCKSWKTGPKANCSCGDSDANDKDDMSGETEDADLAKEGRVATDVTGLGGPSPKMDKKRWKPNALNDHGNLKPLDTDGDRHHTEHQDITEIADHTKDFLEQTDVRLDHNTDIDKSWKGEMNHTDTWSGMSGLADPVTSVTSAVDPDRNPIADLVEYEYEGFVPAHQVEQAVTSHWQKKATPVQAMVNPYGFHNGVNEFLSFMAGKPFAGIPAGSLMIDGRPYSPNQDPLFVGSSKQPPEKAGQMVTVDYPHPQVLAKMIVPTIESGDGSKFMAKMEQLMAGGAKPAAPGGAPVPGAPAPGVAPAVPAPGLA